VNLTLSDAQIIAGIEKLYNPSMLQLGNQVFGDLSNYTSITNAQTFAALEGTFHKIEEYWGGAGGDIKTLKSDNSSASWSYDYGPVLNGYDLTAKVQGSIFAQIGSVRVALGAGYVWSDDLCLDSLAHGLSSFLGSASPRVNLDVYLMKNGKKVRDFKMEFNIVDPGKHQLGFSAQYSIKF